MAYPPLIIRDLDKKDYMKAIQFAIKGMHFNRYTNNSLLLKLYGRYFLYMELNRATQILAAYDGKQLVGLLLATIYGKSIRHNVKMEQVYVSVFNKLQNFYSNGSNVYDCANRTMYRTYRQKYKPDGELIFLAADPNNNRKGVGSILLAELERQERGKELFLYTDSNCTYQFYEHRGFERAAKQEIEMDLPDGSVPLTCYLYHKRLGE